MSSLEDYEMPPIKRRRDPHPGDLNGHPNEEHTSSSSPVLHWYSSSNNHHHPTTGILVNRHILLLLTLSLTSMALGVTSLCLWASFSNTISQMEAIMDTIKINLTKQGEEHSYQMDNRLLFSSSKILATLQVIESRILEEFKDKEESLWNLHQDDINELKENITAVQNLVEKMEMDLQRLSQNGNDTSQFLEKKLHNFESKFLNLAPTLRDQLVPVGFIYVQYGHQAEPTFLWPASPNFRWIEITSNYAGQFFRAVGPNSSPFNSTQDEEAPRLKNVAYTAGPGSALISLAVGSSRSMVRSGYPQGQGHNWGGLTFTMSGGEIRPYNSAIRIWKRVAA